MKALRRSWLLLVVMLAVVLVAAPARAADVDGKWSGSLDTPMGPVEMGFTFKADGATLNGKSTGPDGSEVAIKNGTLDGNRIFVRRLGRLRRHGVRLELSGRRQRGQHRADTRFHGDAHAIHGEEGKLRLLCGRTSRSTSEVLHMRARLIVSSFLLGAVLLVAVPASFASQQRLLRHQQAPHRDWCCQGMALVQPSHVAVFRGRRPEGR